MNNLINYSIKSFVRRNGRMTESQKHILKQCYLAYGVPEETSAWQVQAPCWLEIGMGNGEALISLAKQFPDINFIGMDVYWSGIGIALRQIIELGLDNVRLLNGDAASILQQSRFSQAFNRVHMFFPDPWPKPRHRKRRLLQQPFLSTLSRILAPEGVFHFVTDIADYMMDVQHLLVNQARWRQGELDGVAKKRPMTKFERKAIAEGRATVEGLFRKDGAY